MIYYFIIINLIALFLMYIDKKKAINKKERISEQTLLFFAAIFGSLGILCGMKLFRHKTKKKKFQICIPLIILIQIYIIVSYL